MNLNNLDPTYFPLYISTRNILIDEFVYPENMDGIPDILM